MTLRLNPDECVQAGTILKQGGTVAFPTETVYGLGADATNSAAIQKIFKAKGRPSDNPLIVHLWHLDQLSDCCQRIPSLADQLIESFCPGPLTLVLPKKASIVDSVTAGLNTVAVRFPSHPTSIGILEAANLPIAAPSANRSGRPSATTWQAAIEDLDGLIDAVMCDGATNIGLESTVLDLSNASPVVLRHGSITLEQLQVIEPSIRMLSDVAIGLSNSPGLRHRHYQPRAKVVLCDLPIFLSPFTHSSSGEATHAHAPLAPSLGKVAGGEGRAARNAYIGLSDPSYDLDLTLQAHCRNLDEYAHKLFEFFRECDSVGIETIYCQRVEEIGLGRAIMDRLHRAADTKSTI